MESRTEGGCISSSSCRTIRRYDSVPRIPSHHDCQLTSVQNPRNWSGFKKAVVSFELCLLIIAVYAGASIYTVGVHGVQVHFGVSDVVALLGLTVFVLGYGLGPVSARLKAVDSDENLTWYRWYGVRYPRSPK